MPKNSNRFSKGTHAMKKDSHKCTKCEVGQMGLYHVVRDTEELLLLSMVISVSSVTTDRTVRNKVCNL